MNEYDEEILHYFLEHQTQLFPEAASGKPGGSRRVSGGLHGGCLQKYKRSAGLF